MAFIIISASIWLLFLTLSLCSLRKKTETYNSILKTNQTGLDFSFFIFFSISSLSVCSCSFSLGKSPCLGYISEAFLGKKPSVLMKLHLRLLLRIGFSKPINCLLVSSQRKYLVKFMVFLCRKVCRKSLVCSERSLEAARWGYQWLSMLPLLKDTGTFQLLIKPHPYCSSLHIVLWRTSQDKIN